MEEKKVKRINLLRLSLKKPLPNDDYSLLSWSIRENYPRIQVFTSKNIKKEDGNTNFNKVIIAPFTYPIITMFIDSLAKAILTDEVFSIKCFNNKFVDNKRTDEIEEQAEVKIARSQEGVLHIGVKKDSGFIYFPLFPDLKWHKFFDKNGKEITDKRELSNKMARAYVDLLKGTFINTMLQ